jgi:signal transduction histidine kinase
VIVGARDITARRRFCDGYAVLLQQVLLSLIGKAIKFTRNVPIAIECERLDAGRRQSRIPKRG